MSNIITDVIIIGGGLVGSLSACFMAKRGYKVTLYEQRSDLRNVDLLRGKSINLALSNRGRRALRFIGLEEKVLKNTVPMKGRLLHGLNGETQSVPYDSSTNQCIYSVGRNFLNRALLSEAEKYPNIKLHFEHKLINVNLDEGTVTILELSTGGTFETTATLIIGADGAYSGLRRVMQQAPLFNFSQTFIDHGYIELSITPDRGELMTPNHLHIWPRNQFMMIGLPNCDGSWTVTLFMPFDKFKKLDTPEKCLDFFKQAFPDSVSLLAQDQLLDDFFKAKPSTLISVKCNPWYNHGRFVLLGDAAHAMVPFYGQGMNAGFEDCLVLDELLTIHSGDSKSALQAFGGSRTEDVQAMCDLAMYNYTEMRDLVTKSSYHLRKKFDDLLFSLLPNIWIPLYNSVTFNCMDYKECIKNRKWQDKVIRRIICALPIFIALALYSFINLMIMK